MRLSKVLSLVLAICMLFSMASFAAVSFTDVSADASYAESIEVLTALKIINGYDDGTFKPEGKITRAEFSKVVICALNMQDSSSGSVGGIFTDVSADHWASGFIAAAYQAGIIDGMGDGTFQPESEVTYEQSIKMLVASIGYTPKADALGGYPTGYTMIANQEGITTGTSAAAGGAARATVARLVYNALTVQKMDQTSWGGINGPEWGKDPKQSLLYTNLGVIKTEAVIESIPLDKTDRKVQLEYNTVDTVARNNGWYIAAKTATLKDTDTDSLPIQVNRNDVNLAGLQGLTVTALLDASDSYDIGLLAVISKSGRNDYVDVDPNLLETVYTPTSSTSTTGHASYYKNISDDKPTNIKVLADMNVYKNLVLDTPAYGSATSAVQAANSTSFKDDIFNYRYVDTDNDGTYDAVFVTVIQSFVVGRITSNKIFRDMDMSNAGTNFTSASVNLDPDDDAIDWIIKDAEGNEITVDDIQSGQVANVQESRDGTNYYYDITITDTKIEGTVSSEFEERNRVKGYDETFYTVGGSDYRIFSGLSTLKPGDEIDALVAANGKIIAYEVKAYQRSYALIVARNMATEFTDVYQLQMLKSDGTIATLNLYEKFNSQGTYAEEKSAFESEFAIGTLVVYELNSKNEIKSIAPATGSLNGYNLASIDDALKGGELTAQTYRESSDKIGNYTITDNTAIFTTEKGRNLITKNNVMLSSKSTLIDDTAYTGFVVGNEAREAFAIVLFDAANKVKADSYPMMITKASKVQVDGSSRTKYTGFVRGDEVDLTVAEDKDEFANYSAKDVILYTVNGAGELMNARLLASLNTAGRYEVLTNWKNDGSSSYPDDDDDELAVFGFSLLADKTAATRTNAVQSISSLASKFAPSDKLRGIAVAGKAYQVKGKTLQLMVGTDFASTAAGSDGKRVYNRGTVVDGLLSDITISSSEVAYIYNGSTGSIKATTIADLETDRSTIDYNTDNFDNDDTVYVYNYDGSTYFMLIIDAHGDN